MTIHELKCWPEYFHAIKSGQKRFEVRKDDRNFQIGDLLHLLEWCPGGGNFTGRRLWYCVTYVMRGGAFGIDPAYCVLGIEMATVGQLSEVFESRMVEFPQMKSGETK